MTPLLSLNNIQCKYDNLTAISDLSLELSKGEISCLLGPSGCGKSTVLRAIAGFEPLTSGTIELSGKIISSSTSILAPEKRQIGMVFQDYALFPHLTVLQNIEFGLEKTSRPQNATVRDLISLVNLAGYESRYPHELSGGQQQRVSLARALAPSPNLLLLDEPFSNLDTELRNRLSIDIRNILKELDITAILVTHDQQEAFAMCDNIAVIDQGRVQQWGKPYELYHEPVNRFVACFIGQGSFVQGTSTSHKEIICELGTIKAENTFDWPVGKHVDVLIRPDDILHEEGSNLEVCITAKTFAGTSTSYRLKLNSGNIVEALFPSHQDFEIGETICITLDAEHIIAYPRLDVADNSILAQQENNIS